MSRSPAPATFAGASPRLVLGLVFLAALALRLWAWVAFRGSPFAEQLMVDSQWHDEWAWSWASGTWSMEDRAFFRAPLYPAWLALVYKGFGHAPAVARLFQAILGAGSATLLAAAAWRWGGRRAAIATGALAAGYGTLIFFEGELLIPTLLTFLLAGAIWSFSRVPARGALMLGGLLIGVAAVARPNAVVLILPAVFYVAASVPRPRRLRSMLAVAGLGLAPALGVTAINAAVEGTWVFVASQGGVNLYAGNHAGASGRSVEIPEMGSLITWREFVDRSERIAEEGAGRSLSSREISNWWLHRTLDWMSEHPGDAAALTARKLYYVFNAFEIPNNRSVYYLPAGPVRGLVWSVPGFSLPWGLVFPLAVAGAVALWRDPRRRPVVILLAGWALLYAVSIVPFFVTARFRLGMVPALLVLAGLAVAHLRGLGRAGWITLLLALIVVNTPFAGVRMRNPGLEKARLGEALLREGRTEEAVVLLEEAADAGPGGASGLSLLAGAYGRLGRWEDAARAGLRAVAIRPDDPTLRFNVGVAYLQLERWEEAVQTFTTVTRLRPVDPAGWLNLGVAEEARGRKEAAVQAYERAIREGPGEDLPYLRLGLLYEREEAWSSAVDVYERGVDRIQTSVELRFRLALGYVRTGRPELALEEVDSILHLRPGHEPSRRLQQFLEQNLEDGPPRDPEGGR